MPDPITPQVPPKVEVVPGIVLGAVPPVVEDPNITPEAKAAADKVAADAAAAAAPKVAEAGAFEFKAPEGMNLDAESVKAFTAEAARLGLKNEDTQKLVDIATGQAGKQQAAQAAAWMKQRGTWVGEPPPDEKYLTMAQATKRYDVSRSTLWTWTRRYSLPKSKLGKCTFFRVGDIRAVIERGFPK